MKIALLTSWEVPCGIANYSKELAGALKCLSDVDVDVDVIAIGPQVWEKQGKPMDRRHQIEYLKEAAIRANEADIIHIQFQYPFFGGLAPNKSTFRHLLRYIRKPCLVTLHELDLSSVALAACPLFGCPSSLIHLLSPFAALLKQWFNKRLFVGSPVDAFIVHTQAMREQLVKLGVSKERVRVVPMWVPQVEATGYGYVGVTSREAKRRLRLCENAEAVVGVFGFVVQRKGYELLLDAVEPLLPQIHLVIAGGKHPLDKTDYFERLMKRMGAMGAGKDKRVRVTGYIPDEQIPLWFAAFDIVVAPFTELAASASLLLCIAYGKPVITSDLPSNVELQERAGCLTLFRTGDAEDLRRKIQELVSQPMLREKQSLAALEYAHSYPVSKAAERTAALYKEVISIAHRY